MSILNEDLMKTNLDLPEGEIEILGAADPVYADAINVHEKKKKQVEDALKDQQKLTDNFIKDNGKRETKKVTSPDLKKMNLEESLFEDYNEDSNMYEAFTYDEPTSMGKGHTAPLVDDYSSDIQQLVKMVDEGDGSFAKPSLKRIINRLFDNKQNIENFNNYWSERYPAAIQFIDNQLNMIGPMLLKELVNTNNLDESTAVLDRPINKSKRFKGQEFSTDYIYKAKRDPLADIIQDELTNGEIVYRVSADGKLKPTWAPSLNLNYEDIGASTDDKGDYVIANVADESTMKQVELIGAKYDREVKSGYDKYVSGTPYWVKIYLKDEDWDNPYFDPNVKNIKNYK